MKILEKIVARSSKENRRKGQIKSFLTLALTVAVGSGTLDNYPIAKEVAVFVSGILAKESYNHAITTNEN